MTTVSCVEDDSAYCLLLTRALAKNKTIRILSVHSSAEEALQSLPSLRPDAVLMDIKLPSMSGIECLKQLKKIEPPLPGRMAVPLGFFLGRCDLLVIVGKYLVPTAVAMEGG